jgi:hypothetical protein
VHGAMGTIRKHISFWIGFSLLGDGQRKAEEHVSNPWVRPWHFADQDARDPDEHRQRQVFPVEPPLSGDRLLPYRIRLRQSALTRTRPSAPSTAVTSKLRALIPNFVPAPGSSGSQCVA